MRDVELGATGIRTSALGFGTAGFGARLTERARLRLLETAFDAGIRHFDTAPLYGRGSAEPTVGRFLRGKRERVTVAAKIGLAPPRGGRLGALTRSQGRRIAPSEARRSLERTLRGLGTGHVDLLLLHECRADDPQLDEWVSFLGEAVETGRARASGSATSARETAALLAAGGSFPAVVQVAAGTIVVPADRAAIFHSALAGAADPRAALRSALAERADAVVLFFSSSAEHIASNVAACAG